MILSIEHRMIAWRHDLHANPEFGFAEKRTSLLVAGLLRAAGLDEVIEGVGGTGVVGTLRRGTGRHTIALRADMDALRITETGSCAYSSTIAGLMHACGHDGHTAMLLGAAHILSTDQSLDGTVRFIFQPAEEWGRGALAMLDDGLLERFPFEEIYSLHCWPGLELGRLATRTGPLMAAEDNFEIVVEGKGAHAARPQYANDALVAGCALVTALQTIVARSLDPSETAVVSVTEFLTDGGRNILPGIVRLSGDCRSFSPWIGNATEAAMRRIAEGIASAHGCRATVAYTREFVPLINDSVMTAAAVAAACSVLGADNVDADCQSVAVSEDFARFLAHRPGCFAFLGNGIDSPALHNAAFDFNDGALGFGARYFAEIARRRLSRVG